MRYRVDLVRNAHTTTSSPSQVAAQLTSSGDSCHWLAASRSHLSAMSMLIFGSSAGKIQEAVQYRFEFEVARDSTNTQPLRAGDDGICTWPWPNVSLCEVLATQQSQAMTYWCRMGAEALKLRFRWRYRPTTDAANEPNCPEEDMGEGDVMG